MRLPSSSSSFDQSHIASSQEGRIASSTKPTAAEHYHAAMKRDHPDWNFCPMCNASLLEPIRSDTFGALLSSSDGKLLISISLSPELGTGIVSPFSFDNANKKVPVWAEATHVGSRGLAKERLFEEVIVQHLIPAFKNGFKLVKHSGNESDLLLFMQILAKYTQRELAEQALDYPIASQPKSYISIDKPQAQEIFEERAAPANVVSANEKISRSSSSILSKDSSSPYLASSGRDMVPTGVPGFDIISSGGVPKNRVTLLSGRSGLGKTIFAIQFLLEGVKRNERGILALTDERPQDVLQEMDNLGLPLIKAIQDKRILLVVKDARHEYRIKGAEIVNSRNTQEFFSGIARLSRKHNARLIVIDSLTALLSEYDQLEVRRKMPQIVDELERLECTVLATGDVPSTNKNSLSYFGIEERFVSAVVAFRSTSIGGRIFRYLFIPKMKGSGQRLQKYVFAIEPKVGIRLLEPLQEVLQQERMPGESPPRPDVSLEILSALKAFAALYAPPTNQTTNRIVGPNLVDNSLLASSNNFRGDSEFDQAIRPLETPNSISSAKFYKQKDDEALREGRRSFVANEPKRKDIRSQEDLPNAVKDNPWTKIISERNEQSDSLY